MSRSIKQVTGRRAVEHVDERRFVAVQHLRWGDGHLEPGDKVPIEPGRDYGFMVRHGQIQQVILPNKGGKR